ncbi:hypothetical protein [Falsiroseomonas oryziterrae]|uniref:hypothetical protein n=1 Tax=Falsiroseomonas oryziterrae TaxID=2911368 RepID=UPI001F3CB8A2|nr:hypothetical protein [Roseomonas sp. NPKOSM-4]
MRRLLALPLLLAACATEPPAPAPATWIGRSEADLVSQLGVPHRLLETDGRRFLAYDGPGGTVPFVTPSLGFGYGSVSGGWGRASGFGTGLGLTFGPGASTGPCTTTFEVRDARVIGATRQGPGCG